MQAARNPHSEGIGPHTVIPREGGILPPSFCTGEYSHVRCLAPRLVRTAIRLRALPSCTCPSGLSANRAGGGLARGMARTLCAVWLPPVRRARAPCRQCTLIYIPVSSTLEWQGWGLLPPRAHPVCRGHYLEEGYGAGAPIRMDTPAPSASHSCYILQDHRLGGHGPGLHIVRAAPRALSMHTMQGEYGPDAPCRQGGTQAQGTGSGREAAVAASSYEPG